MRSQIDKQEKIKSERMENGVQCVYEMDEYIRLKTQLTCNTKKINNIIKKKIEKIEIIDTIFALMRSIDKLEKTEPDYIQLNQHLSKYIKSHHYNSCDKVYFQNIKLSLEKEISLLKNSISTELYPLSNEVLFPDEVCSFICSSGSKYFFPPPNCGCGIICHICYKKYNGKCATSRDNCRNSVMHRKILNLDDTEVLGIWQVPYIPRDLEQLDQPPEHQEELD